MSQDGKKRTFKLAHELPGKFKLDYILLPYGSFYEKTNALFKAKPGDTVRFFNGPEVPIVSVRVIPFDGMCNFLCRMRYGIDWEKALEKWRRYAALEGHSKDVISGNECILVIYNATDTE